MSNVMKVKTITARAISVVTGDNVYRRSLYYIRVVVKNKC